MSLISSSYGKDLVKFLKIKRDPVDSSVQDVIEVTCRVLLEGAFDASYTDADNASIVPTDTVKNTILIEARTSEVWPIERFAAHLADHFVVKYSHVTGVSVSISQKRWERYDVKGKPHPHAFVLQPGESRDTQLHYKRGGEYTLSSAIKGLTVLKSTGLMFYGYNVCDYTTLKPTKDRILSTDVDATWHWDVSQLGSLQDVAQPLSGSAAAGVMVAGKFKPSNDSFDLGYCAARDTVLKMFAEENSVSVQATMFNMSKRILAEVPQVATVDFSLPNKHYIAVDMGWKGLDNTEVFYPAAHPSGLIKSEVGRAKL